MGRLHDAGSVVIFLSDLGAEMSDLIHQLPTELEKERECRKELDRAVNDSYAVNSQLRAELAAALAACKVKDAKLRLIKYETDIHGTNLSKHIRTEAISALAIQPDDAALKAWLGEPECFYDGYKFYSNEMSAACDMANLANLRPLYSPKGLK